MKKSVVALLLVLLIAGCGKTKAPEADPAVLKTTVIHYNALLAEGYKNLNMNPLAQAATKERAQKAYYHMAALGEERKKMKADLRNLTFLEVRLLPEDKGEVRTKEDWDYTHVNIDSHEVVFRNSVTYELKYTLVREEDRWLVSDITVEKEESREKGEL